LASHYDAIISVHLTSVFSGTYSSSIKAAKRISEEFGKPIISIDSKNLSGGLGLIVLRIAQEIEKGSSFLEIQGKIEEWKHKTKIFVSVKTMKYMVKGGRVSPAKGLVSKILNVKPIVSVDESGNSFLFGKTFSQRSNMTKVIGHIRALAREQRIWNYVVLHAQNEAAAAWYVAEMRKITGFEPCSVVNISPVIGMNAGLGAASVAIMFH
jgi:DegV family protein with EDD domain